MNMHISLKPLPIPIILFFLHTQDTRQDKIPPQAVNMSAVKSTEILII